MTDLNGMPCGPEPMPNCDPAPGCPDEPTGLILLSLNTEMIARAMCSVFTGNEKEWQVYMGTGRKMLEYFLKSKAP